MTPSRELDLLIATKIFKQKVIKTVWGKDKQYSCYTIGQPDYCYTSDCPEGQLMNRLPNYSTNIAAAWEIIEKFQGKSAYGFSIVQNYEGLWSCLISLNKGRIGLSKHCKSASHAICEAALNACQKINRKV